MESMLKKNILTITVPSNCTDFLRNLDLSVNKPLKDQLRHIFQTWYSEQVSKQLQEGKEPEDVKVDMRLSIMKPLIAKWITSQWFVEAGIIATINEADNKILEAGDATPEGDPLTKDFGTLNILVSHIRNLALFK